MYEVTGTVFYPACDHLGSDHSSQALPQLVDTQPDFTTPNNMAATRSMFPVTRHHLISKEGELD